MSAARQSIDEALGSRDALRVETARAAETGPGKWLGLHKVHGDLAQNRRFGDAFGGHLRAICAKGVETAIREFLATS